MSQDKCGYQKSDDSKPCGRQAGWGVDEDKDNPEGLCKDHLKLADGQIDSIKKEFCEILREEVTPISKAAKDVGKSHSTITRWRREDEEFDRKVRDAKDHQQDMRNQKIEDKLFQRIIKDEAAASETIFYLKNKAGWESEPAVEVNQQQSQGQQNSIPEDLQDVIDDGVQIARQEQNNE